MHVAYVKAYKVEKKLFTVNQKKEHTLIWSFSDIFTQKNVIIRVAASLFSAPWTADEQKDKWGSS